MKRKIGLIGAAVLVVSIVLFVTLTDFSSHVDRGIIAGMIVAYFQAIVSLIAMKKAMQGKRFLWVWAGGFFFRLMVFCLTAYVTYKHTTLNLAATMVTLVGVTTALMALESWAYFVASPKGQN